jgi:hypothetical protein
MSKAKIVPEGRHAILAIDPGNTTGVGACHIDLKVSRSASFSDGLHMLKNIEVRGPWNRQGAQLAEIANRFLFTAGVEHSIPVSRCHIVCENFVLRRLVEGGATGNLTSVWVAASFVGYLNRDDIEVDWQMPSDGKSVNNELLKMYGIYVVGSEHMRDANRHIAVKVDKLLRGA